MIVVSRGQLDDTYRRIGAFRYCDRTLFGRISEFFF
jgi:hypothetical protein